MEVFLPLYRILAKYYLENHVQDSKPDKNTRKSEQ